MQIEQHFAILGCTVEDVVTGFKGVASTLSFDLYGCVQVVITPQVNKDGETKDGKWFDITRLKVTNSTPVMAMPNFIKGYVATGKKGCADKSIPN